MSYQQQQQAVCSLRCRVSSPQPPGWAPRPASPPSPSALSTTPPPSPTSMRATIADAARLPACSSTRLPPTPSVELALGADLHLRACRYRLLHSLHGRRPRRGPSTTRHRLRATPPPRARHRRRDPEAASSPDLLRAQPSLPPFSVRACRWGLCRRHLTPDSVGVGSPPPRNPPDPLGRGLVLPAPPRRTAGEADGASPPADRQGASLGALHSSTCAREARLCFCSVSLSSFGDED